MEVASILTLRYNWTYLRRLIPPLLDCYNSLRLVKFKWRCAFYLNRWWFYFRNYLMLSSFCGVSIYLIRCIITSEKFPVDRNLSNILKKQHFENVTFKWKLKSHFSYFFKWYKNNVAIIKNFLTKNNETIFIKLKELGTGHHPYSYKMSF